MQALAGNPRQLDDLADRVDQLRTVSKVALVVEGLAILNTPIAIGVRDVVLVIVDRHESARLGTQQLQKSFEIVSTTSPAWNMMLPPGPAPPRRIDKRWYSFSKTFIRGYAFVI